MLTLAKVCSTLLLFSPLERSQTDRYLSINICARMSWPFGASSSWFVFQYSTAGLRGWKEKPPPPLSAENTKLRDKV